MSEPAASGPRPSYFYNPIFPTFYFGLHHPMKPFRAAMVNELILSYGLDEHLNYYQPRDATFQDLTLYHTPDYIRFLKNIAPETVQKFQDIAKKYNLTDDCPVFSGLYDYCAITVGGSMTACAHLNHGITSTSISWMGGFHHAKASESSGFCYANDIVLGIIELLKVHERVAYFDIDIHAGDGVEEAFYTTPRVLTCSVHKYGKDFFPGTGNLYDTGAEAGKGYAVNFPLDDSVTDNMYIYIFRELCEAIFQYYRPSAVVLQCGADSLAGDRLGCFNLTLKGHGECVRILKNVCHRSAGPDVPLFLCGGGGYTARSAAKCWTYETAIMCGQMLSEQIPANQFYEYYGPDFSLLINRINMPNQNKEAEIERKLRTIKDQLRGLRINVAGGATMNEVPLAHAEADADLYKGKDRDYDGGRLHEEDLKGNGQHEGEGVSEGERRRARGHRSEPTVVMIDGTADKGLKHEMDGASDNE